MKIAGFSSQPRKETVLGPSQLQEINLAQFHCLECKT